MAPVEKRSVLGKWVQVIMDSDHSAEVLSGKGKIIHLYSNPPAREAVAIDFKSETRKGLLRRNRNRYLILEYPPD